MRNAQPFRPADTPEPEDHESHTRAAAREFFASALYVAIVLLAALVALPKTALPADGAVAATLLGTAIGLVVAHFLAFRFAASFTSEGGVAPASVIREAAAGLAGGAIVAVLAALPFAVWNGENALMAALVTLALLPALMGMAISRLRGRSWAGSLLAAGIGVLVAAFAVAVKYLLGH